MSDDNILDGLNSELTRCRELLKLYESIPTGKIGAVFIRIHIKRGEDALESGDVVKMVEAYEELKACE